MIDSTVLDNLDMLSEELGLAISLIKSVNQPNVDREIRGLSMAVSLNNMMDCRMALMKLATKLRKADQQAQTEDAHTYNLLRKDHPEDVFFSLKTAMQAILDASVFLNRQHDDNPDDRLKTAEAFVDAAGDRVRDALAELAAIGGRPVKIRIGALSEPPTLLDRLAGIQAQVHPLKLEVERLANANRGELDSRINGAAGALGEALARIGQVRADLAAGINDPDSSAAIAIQGRHITEEDTD